LAGIKSKIPDFERGRAKNDRNYLVDIPRIIFSHNADIGQKGHLCMDTNFLKYRAWGFGMP